MKKGFDSREYTRRQTSQILERISRFDNKLYLEFGGKIFDDFHAARVLPGFDPNGKIKLLYELRDRVEVVFCVCAADIEKTKIRADIGITYDMEVLRLISLISKMGILVSSVVITQYTGQSAVEPFRRRLEMMGVRHYTHYPIKDYPTDINTIVSPEGYGKNDYIETTRPLVVVTAPGPGSGKLATCLSQLYHEHKRGRAAGYAKFETFPIWNLPLKHPVNLAYEAATADLQDINMIDPFHLEAYGVSTVNYNRDVEIYPVLAAIFEGIYGYCPYKSPTDMGVNMAGNCIIDDEACCEASRQEIIRRFYAEQCSVKKGLGNSGSVDKIKLIMKKTGISLDERPVIAAAKAKAEETGEPAMAIETGKDTLVTGKTSLLMGAGAAAMLNALKSLAGINDDIHLLSPAVIEPVQELKVKYMGNHNPRLHVDEVLIALSVSAATNPLAKLALQQIPKLRGMEAHATVILKEQDESVFKKFGINITCEPKYQTKKLYHK